MRAPLLVHVFMQTCTEPQKPRTRRHKRSSSRGSLECLSVNGRIVRFGLPPLPHCFSLSLMHAHGHARTQTRRQTAAPLYKASEETHTELSRPLYLRLRRRALYLSSRKPGATREPPGGVLSVRRRKGKTGGVVRPLTPFRQVCHRRVSSCQRRRGLMA